VRGRIDGEQDQEGEGTDGALFIVVRPVCATLAPPGFSTDTSGRTLGSLSSQYRVPSSAPHPALPRTRAPLVC
jgi:hypothetical protein